MLNKIYEKTLQYIKKEYKFLITLIITLAIFTIRLPYYIDMPGGLINISNRITLDDKKLSGTLNMAYVSETRATLPSYIVAKLNKDWDIIKKEKIILKNETEEEVKFRDELDMNSAISNALYVGLKESNQEFTTKNHKLYVTHIYENAKTDLKIKDQIIEVNNKKINTYEDLKQINNMKKGDTIEIKVINNNKEYIRHAELIELENKTIIGILTGETFDIETNHKIKINNKARESGPSGGMMMALSVYSYLTEDLTNNKKISGTGTIDKEGNVGEIGGVKYKLIGAVKNKADIFLVPNGENYEEAIKVKNEKGYDIKIVGVSTLKEAIETLKNYN